MAQDSQSIDSLYDFLYIDRERLSSYSAQLNNNGTLTSVKSFHNTSNKDGSDFGFGIPKVASVSTNNEAASSNGLERHFDPSWTLPLNVIDMLDENGLILKDIHQANFGQLVQVNGAIYFTDLGLIKNLWPHFGKLLTIGMQEITAAGKRKKQEKEAENKLVSDIISQLPHLLSFKMRDVGYSTWSTLKPENMVINHYDLLMKHGTDIAGIWHMIGVLDAKPGVDNCVSSAFRDNKDQTNDDSIEEMMGQFVNGLRGIMGRDERSFGVTPLVILRQITGR